MNQAELRHLVSGLRIKVGAPRKYKNLLGPRGGLEKLRKHVTALVVNERIEYIENVGYMTRQYTERLISDAVTFGDKHKHTMEMAAWWLDHDKSAVHKLFKVLVPRFQDYTTSYTRMFKAPLNYTTHEHRLDKVLVELKGNPFPPLAYSNTMPNRNHIHNVLLAEAKKDLKLSGSESLLLPPLASEKSNNNKE